MKSAIHKVMKSESHEVMMSASQHVRKSTSQKVNNNENVGKLKASLDELNGSMTEFDQNIIINDCKTLKQDYGEEH